MMNEYLINPGITGSLNAIPIRLQARQQWTGVKGAPSTQIISAHSLLNPEMGVGGYIFKDKFGPISSTGVQATYAYHLKINQNVKLGLGVGFALFQFQFDERDLISIEENDNVLTGGVESRLVPDANIGAYLYSEKYFAGLSILQILQNSIGFENQTDGAITLSRQYYLYGGYKFELNANFYLQASILLKVVAESPFEPDINLKAFYKKNYWLGLSYRSDDSFVTMLGIKYQKYYFGYSVGFSFSTLKNYTHGCHEIVIGIDIPNKVLKSKSSY